MAPGRALLPLALLLPLAGCIQSEESRTFYLEGDGRVDMVVRYDNVRSTDPGEKGAQEERDWLAAFREGATDEQKKLAKLGALDVRAIVLRDKAPFSAVLRASFASAADFGAFFDLEGPERGGTVSLVKDGKARTLQFRMSEKPKKPEAKPQPGEPAVEKSTQTFPSWTFVPVGGKVADGALCPPDPGRSSCTLDFRELERLGEASGSYDFAIAWELGAPDQR